MSPLTEYTLSILILLGLLWFASVFFFPAKPTNGNPPIDANGW